VGEWRFARALPFVVEAREFGIRDEYLPAQLDQVWHRVRRPFRQRGAQDPRQRADREHIGRDIIALHAVAARHRPDQLAVFIRHTDRQAVELRLDHILEIAASQLTHQAGIERP
jgi:hypothetical protein